MSAHIHSPTIYKHISEDTIKHTYCYESGGGAVRRTGCETRPYTLHTGTASLLNESLERDRPADKSEDM